MQNISSELNVYFKEGMKLKGKKYDILVTNVKKCILKKKVKTTIFTKEDYKFELPKQILYTFFGGIRANIVLDEEESNPNAKWVKDINSTFENTFENFISLLSAAIETSPSAGYDVICNLGLQKDLFMMVMAEVMK